MAGRPFHSSSASAASSCSPWARLWVQQQEKMRNQEIEKAGSIPAKTGFPGRLFRWNPQPITPPEIDPDLGELNPLVRAAEVMSYSARRLEHWLSPNGILREWVRLNFLVAAIIAVVGFLVVPVLACLLGGIAECIALILQIVTGTIAIAVAVITSLIIVRYLMTAKNNHAWGDWGNRP